MMRHCQTVTLLTLLLLTTPPAYTTTNKATLKKSYSTQSTEKKIKQRKKRKKKRTIKHQGWLDKDWLNIAIRLSLLIGVIIMEGAWKAYNKQKQHEYWLHYRANQLTDDKNGQKLYRACYNGNINQAQKILDDHPNLLKLDKHKELAKKTLCLAIDRDVNLVKLLLNKGAKPNPSSGPVHKSPLCLAIKSNSNKEEAIELLLKSGASPNIDITTWSDPDPIRLLLVTIREGKIRASDLLLQYGAHMNIYAYKNENKRPLCQPLLLVAIDNDLKSLDHKRVKLLCRYMIKHNDKTIDKVLHHMFRQEPSTQKLPIDIVGIVNYYLKPADTNIPNQCQQAIEYTIQKKNNTNLPISRQHSQRYKDNCTQIIQMLKYTKDAEQTKLLSIT